MLGSEAPAGGGGGGGREDLLGGGGGGEGSNFKLFNSPYLRCLEHAEHKSAKLKRVL